MQSLRRYGMQRIGLLAGAVTLALGAHAQSQSQSQSAAEREASRSQAQTSEQRQGSEQRQDASQREDAQQRQASSQGRSERRSDQRFEEGLESWSQMEGEVVRAEDLLDGDVSNGVNPIGSVSDLVLSEDGRRVEHILYEVPYPFGFYGNESGFTTFEGADIFRHAGLDLEVRVPLEADQPQGPDELQLTAAEAERRLASRIMSKRMYFSPEESRQIEDMLIDRETGEIVHYVVETDQDAIFRTDRRTVPAEQVSIGEQGEISATIELAGLDDVQQYDTELL